MKKVTINNQRNQLYDFTNITLKLFKNLNNGWSSKEAKMKKSILIPVIVFAVLVVFIMAGCESQEKAKEEGGFLWRIVGICICPLFFA